MSERFETERLVGERVRPDDEDVLLTLHQDERVMATMGGVWTRERLREWLERELRAWDEHGFGAWIVRERETGAFVGRVVVRHVFIGGRDEVEIGYALMSEHWNRGYATELARALVRIAQEHGLTDLVAFTLPTNRASQRVMEKAGFAYECDVEHVGLPHVLYRLRQ